MTKDELTIAKKLITEISSSLPDYSISLSKITLGQYLDFKLGEDGTIITDLDKLLNISNTVPILTLNRSEVNGVRIFTGLTIESVKLNRDETNEMRSWLNVYDHKGVRFRYYLLKDVDSISIVPSHKYITLNIHFRDKSGILRSNTIELRKEYKE